MDIKKISSWVNRLICLLFVFSSFGHLISASRVQARKQTQNLIQRLGQSAGNKTKCDLSYINQKFHEFTNALFFYEARLKKAHAMLKQWQTCLNTDFVARVGNCAGLTDVQLNEKISLLNNQIAELTANQNRIVTLPEAFKKYWYALIPIIAAGALLADQRKAEKARIRWREMEMGPIEEQIHDLYRKNNFAVEDNDPELRDLLRKQYDLETSERQIFMTDLNLIQQLYKRFEAFKYRRTHANQ